MVAATLLVGRQQKRRPDIQKIFMKVLLFVVSIFVINMLAAILPISMGSIVVAYGYDTEVPWPLWVRLFAFFAALPNFAGPVSLFFINLRHFFLLYWIG